MEEDGEMADHAALVVSDQTRVGIHEEISRSRPPRWPTTEEKTTPRTHFFPLKKHVLRCKKYPQGARIKPCFMSNALPLKWMIGAASFGLAMDQNLMAPNLTAIADEFGMTPEERDRKLGGEIAFAFFLLGAPASIAIGVATDQVSSRRDLLAATTLLGSLATFSSGFTTSFHGLFWSRALAGGAVGGMMPLCLSLLADIFGPEERTAVVALLSTVTGVGTGFGQNLGGVLGPLLGWRAPFVLAALPAIAVAVCTFLFCEDPVRGVMDTEAGKEEGGERKRRRSGEGEDDEYHAATEEKPSSKGGEGGENSLEVKSRSDGVARGDGDGGGGVEMAKRVGVDSGGDGDEARVLGHGGRPTLTAAEGVDDDGVGSRGSRSSRRGRGAYSGISNDDGDDNNDDDDDEGIGHRSETLLLRTAHGGISLETTHDEDKQAGEEERGGVRGGQQGNEEKNKDDEKSGVASDFARDVKVLCRTPSVLLAYAQGVPGCVPWGIIGTFLNDYLAQDRGLGVLASTAVQTLLGVGGLAGTLASGACGQKLYNRSRPLLPLFGGAAAIAGVAPFLLLLNLPPGQKRTNTPSAGSEGGGGDTGLVGETPSGGALGGGAGWGLLGAYFAVAFAAGALICVTGNCVRSMVQNTTLPRARGTAFALFNLSDDVGKGLGPLAVSLLVTQFSGHRRPAFNLATCGWLLCGLLNLLAATTIERDVAQVVRVLQGAAPTQAPENGGAEAEAACEHGGDGLPLRPSDRQHQVR